MDALSIIRDLAGGDFLDRLAEELRQTAAEVRDTGSPGAVTTKVDLKPLGEPGNPAVAFETSFDRKPPKKKARGTIFYVDPSGDLVRSDPRQIPMEFRAVESEAQIRQPADAPSTVREA